MEAIDPGTASVSPRWVSRLVEVLQPLSVRADRLGSMPVFAGLGRTELEFAAGVLSETLIERGTRFTIQGRPVSGMWLISEGEALVSADARPVRVAGRGDVIGVSAMLYGTKSPETAIALTPICAFAAGRDQFRRLIAHRPIRLRLAAEAGDQVRSRRPPGRSPSRQRAGDRAQHPGG